MFLVSSFQVVEVIAKLGSWIWGTSEVCKPAGRCWTQQSMLWRMDHITVQHTPVRQTP